MRVTRMFAPVATALAVLLTGAVALAPVAAASAAGTGTGTVAAAAAAPERQATATVRTVSCGKIDRAAYAPIGGKWSRTYNGSCGHIARQSKPYITVSWEVPRFSSGQACVKARGFRWSDGKEYRVSLGCGKSGHGTVHWGKAGTQIIATTAVKALSQSIVTGVPVYFTD
ncbi:hypothetical protein [Pseudonocardia sp. HH130629-09]|uniref:hypothetical protein n=1 Tax=Pseudonocardia sp. HH130629-09 TaxID=1641402 RepID=UPI000A992659|nr:hypothetical protein [Pseudonocardia sp. HH130629-09]